MITLQMIHETINQLRYAAQLHHEDFRMWRGSAYNVTGELNARVEDERDYELADVVAFLRAKSSLAFLTARGRDGDILDDIVRALEAHEHRR